MNMACLDDTCSAPVAIASAVSRLLSAIDDLLDAQGSGDVTWLAIDHAMTFCDAFVEHYPTMTISTLVGGLDVTSAALHARANHERPESGDA